MPGGGPGAGRPFLGGRRRQRRLAEPAFPPFPLVGPGPARRGCGGRRTGRRGLSSSSASSAPYRPRPPASVCVRTRSIACYSRAPPPTPAPREHARAQSSAKQPEPRGFARSARGGGGGGGGSRAPRGRGEPHRGARASGVYNSAGASRGRGPARRRGAAERRGRGGARAAGGCRACARGRGAARVAERREERFPIGKAGGPAEGLGGTAAVSRDRPAVVAGAALPFLPPPPPPCCGSGVPAAEGCGACGTARRWACGAGEQCGRPRPGPALRAPLPPHARPRREDGGPRLRPARLRGTALLAGAGALRAGRAARVLAAAAAGRRCG
ncbi:uncharacterized protein LOC130151388 [Falco biarmicus]|uniref:uncharacterized protein LOC130151388 n=1 Tax=Falco biarmicus TaxID=345155 RepID=UPI0024BC2412|nr:uncharacterized protein LOC130151388 [Falco biarmicus]